MAQEPKYKVGDKVMLPRHGNYNPRFDRDIRGYVRELRVGRMISYRVGKTRYLENLLRDMGGTAMG